MSIYDFIENSYYIISHQTYPDLIDLILNRWKLLKPKYSILDIGTGEGALALELLEHIDVYFELCDIDGEKMSSIPFTPSVSINVTDAAELHFSDESFDTVFCINALHHFERAELCLKEAARVLKKRGKLLIVEYEKKNPVTRAFHIAAKIQGRYRRFFSLHELVQYLEPLGLETRPMKINKLQIAVIAEKKTGI
jgi:ubiquinone/menaquinone biosynthesis C-methylase UbiE